MLPAGLSVRHWSAALWIRKGGEGGEAGWPCLVFCFAQFLPPFPFPTLAQPLLSSGLHSVPCSFNPQVSAHMCHFDLITPLLRLPSLPQPLATVARFVPSASNTSLLSLGLTSSSPCSRPVSSDLLMVPSTGIHSPGEIL